MDKNTKVLLDDLKTNLSEISSKFLFNTDDDRNIYEEKIKDYINTHYVKTDILKFKKNNDSIEPDNFETAIILFCAQIGEKIPNIYELIGKDIYELENFKCSWKDGKFYIIPHKLIESIEINFTVDKDGNIIYK